MKYAYIGCRTTKERNARGKGISVYKIENGKWELVQMVENLVNPSYLCFDKTGDFLYTIHGDFSEISAFAVDKSNGKLNYLNTVSTEGENPVHLSIDKGNRYIYVANLQTGSVVVLPRNADGSLAPLKHKYYIPGIGEGNISHPHQVEQDKDGDFLLVSCQGRKAGFGQVSVFKINHEDGSLEKCCTVKSREIAEPRHLAFHPNNHWCYGVNEKDYSVTYYHFDSEKGQLVAQQIVPTLPDSYTGDGWASGILVSQSGNYVVVSNRKHDSITSFAIDPQNGKLKYCDCIKTEGGQPRFITLDEEGKHILAANETTDTITRFALDEATGKFSKVDWTLASESPVCIVFSA